VQGKASARNLRLYAWTLCGALIKGMGDPVSWALIPDEGEEWVGRLAVNFGNVEYAGKSKAMYLETVGASGSCLRDTLEPSLGVRKPAPGVLGPRIQLPDALQFPVAV
jgi:hypothetical protein